MPVIIEKGIDICLPVPCQTLTPKVVIVDYPPTIFDDETITVEWNVIDSPSTLEVESNKFLWSNDPFDIDTPKDNEITATVSGSDGAGPYTISFAAPDGNSVIYFQIKMIINNVTRFSDLYSIIISTPSTATSTPRVDPPGIDDRN